jgi:hypothetical protein
MVFKLDVDGRPLDYQYNVSMGPKADRIFRGFRTSQSSYEAFVFDFPTVRTDVDRPVLGTELVRADAAGSLTVKIHEAFEAEVYGDEVFPKRERSSHLPPVISGEQKTKLSQSLTTRGGGPVYEDQHARVRAASRARGPQYTYRSGALIASLSLQCQTVSALLLRGILRRDVPAHRELMPPDMLAPPARAVVIGGSDRPGRPAEVALCDLTAEAVPQWTSKRRIVETVEMVDDEARVVLTVDDSEDESAPDIGPPSGPPAAAAAAAADVDASGDEDSASGSSGEEEEDTEYA